MGGGARSTRRFVGIDMASHSGRTGAAWIEERRDAAGKLSLRAHLTKSGYRQQSGLDQLVDMCRSATRCAVDSPLGWPSSTMALLSGNGAPMPRDPDVLRFRLGDLAVKDRLREMSLPASWVSSPLRVEYIWRALLLIRRVGDTPAAARRGEGRFCETHARLAGIELLFYRDSWDPRARKLITAAKRVEKVHREEAIFARRFIFKTVVEAFNAHVGKGAFKAADWRRLDTDPTVLNAFLCALVAYARELGACRIYPASLHTSSEGLDNEGRIFTPDWSTFFGAVGMSASEQPPVQ